MTTGMTDTERAGLVRRSPARTALWLIGLVCVVICGLTAWRIIVARSVDLQDGQGEIRNLARALADHAHATIEIADIVLSGLVERVETDGTSPAAVARLHEVMRQKTGAGFRVRDLFVFNAGGVVIATSLPALPEGPAREREYLSWHRDYPGRAPHLGPPVKGLHSGRWTLTVSRRVDLPDGSFGGVVVATIDAETFSAFYASFDVGPQGSIALAAEDGTLLVRHPPLPHLIGTTPAAFSSKVVLLGPVGMMVGPSPLDGVVRYSSYRRDTVYPLLVLVARSEADMLREWRHDSAIVLATTGVLVLALGLLGWRLADQIRQRQRVEEDLMQSEERFRLLADNSTDLIIHSQPGKGRVYASPASFGLLGYTPAEMIAFRPTDTVHPDDRVALERHMEIVHGGLEPDMLHYRVRRRDGTYMWAEAISRNIGDGRGIVVAIRDITARKTVEGQLHEANNQLHRIAMQDGLTGIANRRAFDLVLEKEFRRCARGELPLAALLIDVDHFKTFNDTYGHGAGDECLVRIAVALEQQISRPADVVARYGGEEFVVLLPETDQAGAMHCGEKLLAAIQALAISHEDDGVGAGVVTVSIGVAVGWPGPTGASPRALIDAADGALYEAKRGGRARVCLGQPVLTGTAAA